MNPDRYFNSLMKANQRKIDDSIRTSESIKKRADELFEEALDDPMTLVQMDKDYDLFQDSLGRALTLVTAAKAGHMTHRYELVNEIDKIWHRLDKACVHRAEKEEEERVKGLGFKGE